jgi:hypothetical protein
MMLKVNLIGDFIGKYIFSNLEYILMLAIAISGIFLLIWKFAYA